LHFSWILDEAVLNHRGNAVRRAWRDDFEILSNSAFIAPHSSSDHPFPYRLLNFKTVGLAGSRRNSSLGVDVGGFVVGLSQAS
jgi:hypothetical protein